jgi:hypothetical protein
MSDNNITTNRASIQNAMWGHFFQEVRVTKSGSAIALVQTADDKNEELFSVFEPQNAVIIEVRNGGVPKWEYDFEKTPKELQHASPFNWFEVDSILSTKQDLLHLGGKLVTFNIWGPDAINGLLPVEIVLYARDRDAEVELVRAFRADEENLLTKCEPVRYMCVKMPVKIGSEALDVQGLLDEDEAFAASLEEDGNQPEIGEGMNLGDILAKHFERQEAEEPLRLKPEWRVS